ncbi:unnamed protein product [Cuscuta campestris]|uniref:Uncharacterized protein n=1 Tax=Cuscuta campestris TaxID=132261 RepID=A0A484NBA2_9ASTE|nr:unnamed protein product [Cuscuta campestris]
MGFFTHVCHKNLPDYYVQCRKSGNLTGKCNDDWFDPPTGNSTIHAQMTIWSYTDSLKQLELLLKTPTCELGPPLETNQQSTSTHTSTSHDLGPRLDNNTDTKFGSETTSMQESTPKEKASTLEDTKRSHRSNLGPIVAYKNLEKSIFQIQQTALGFCPLLFFRTN